MVAPTSMPIDPALLAEEESASGRQIAGAKRKPRISNVVSSPIPPVERSTRRSSRNAPVANEPARGEEENLNTYDASAKRSRKNSPGPPGRSSKRHASDAHVSQGESSRLAEKPPERSMPYPYGLTPFRYPCHNPHLPIPPPGNPSDPNFHPFDPSAPASSSEPREIGTRGQHPESSTEIATPVTGTGSNADVSQYLSNSDYPPLDTSDAAFQSLSALLAASQESDPGAPNHPQQ